MANRNNLRIIGGVWRSRRIQFINSPKIRPTPDRVRETLFNWLAANISGANCLDLFAGSGALGFEALSRGANHVVMVEQDAGIVAMLTQQKNLLHAEGVDIKHQHALNYLKDISREFDLIFLDPPFATDLLERSITIILERHLLSSRGLLYVESASTQTCSLALDSLKVVHEKVIGEVRFALYEIPLHNNIAN